MRNFPKISPSPQKVLYSSVSICVHLRFSAFNNVMKILRVFTIALLSCLLLAGCVQYGVTVNFESQTHGEIIQRIQLGERLTSFSNDIVEQWLNSIEGRARSLQGRTKRLSNQEVLVKIPFNNGADLADKFNQFFNPVDPKNAAIATAATDLPKFECHLDLKQNNFLFLIRNQLRLELDLRSLSLLSTEGSVLVSPGALLDLGFSLNTPWGAKTGQRGTESLTPESYQEGRQLVWKLRPGEINHLDATFWIPSPVGIGAVIIILLSLAGSYLKYQILPALKMGRGQKPATSKG